MRKGFSFISREDAVTPVRDHVSKTIPEQALGLRQMLMEFAYLGTEKLSEIVNRGYDGDEDDPNILGVDVGALDFAEVHDRWLDLSTPVTIPAEPVEAPVESVEAKDPNADD